MLSDVDNAIVRFLDEHDGRSFQKYLLSDLRARWNEGYVRTRIRTLVSRGLLTKEKDTSGHILLVLVPAQEISA